jgi:hypothetical protein
VTAVLCEVFVAVLRSARRELNARFAEARHAYPALDADAFTAFLASSADPLVRAVAAARPERAGETARVAYELGLELVGQRLAGPRARSAWIESAWTRVLCPAAALVAAEPQRMLGAVSNAVHNLDAAPDARPGAWIEALEELAPGVADADTFLALGQVLAWRSGLAHYRSGALDVADRLPASLALAAVGAAPANAWPTVRDRLRADPWYVPGQEETPRGLAARVGAFRGFGGLFVEPPRVAALGGQIFVHSAGEFWLLCADACGATFHRATEAEAAAAKPGAAQLPAGVSLPAWAGAVTSAAATQSTLAVSAALTHSVLLFARSPA